ncbi:hypothetical protein OPIT5_10645 [Opitutaceae bacterium TAV5]|nr:hypothetical protein OPIT5_10645 [Opitutaceae bacterium TAV5]
MARKLRIQFGGARYHVINRGNYRKDLFGTAGAAKAFEECLGEACELNGWILHAWTIMRNHFHLALETPGPNLVEGMHWLQSTFATRFNRFRNERGHLFQGRYQALLIENDDSLGRVVDYIHLNPVRAGIVALEHLAGFRWSSLRRFLRGTAPAHLVADSFMGRPGLPLNQQGWSNYLLHLQELAANPAEQERLGFATFSRGWAIGTEAWKKALAREFSRTTLAPGLQQSEIAEFREQHYRQALSLALVRIGKTETELATASPDAPWTLDLALLLRKNGVPHPYIASIIHLPSPDVLRARLSRKKRSLPPSSQHSASPRPSS